MLAARLRRCIITLLEVQIGNSGSDKTRCQRAIAVRLPIR